MAEAVQAWVRMALGQRSAPVGCAEVPEGSVAEGSVAEGSVAEASGPELLSLGGDGSGERYVLNLSTGAIDVEVALPLVCDPDHEPVHPLSQVTSALIVLICKRGGYHAQVDESGDVTVFTGVGEVQLTRLGEQSDLIMISRLFPFAETTPARDRAKLVRRLNKRSVVVRFEADVVEYFLAQCPLLVTAGLSPAQFLATLRIFADQTQMHMTACKAYRLLA